MSNEVNITQVAYGTMDPGVSIEWYLPRPDYDEARRKVAAFTVVPDPVIGGIEIAVLGETTHIDLDITRVWNTVWSTGTERGIDHVFQRNARVSNTAGVSAAYELLLAETDN
jgi:hypothetical protein